MKVLSSRCSSCGFPLRAGKTQDRSKIGPVPLLITASAVFLLVIVILILPRIFSSKEQPLGQKSTAMETATAIPTETSSGLNLKTIGRLIFLDLSGEEISGMDTAVVAGSWIAVPTWRGFNGNAWIFQSRRTQESRIEHGIWRLGDPVGLWRCQDRYESPELAAWQVHEPLSWHSYISGNSVENVRVTSPQPKGPFLSVTLPLTIQEPGIFFQHGRVVGWSFGSDMKYGFMWNGPDGKALKPEIEIADFYNQTFSNVQEAQFSRALAFGDEIPAQERLEALAQGFRLLPRLDEDDKPFQLRADSALNRMQKLASDLMQNGFTQDVIDILDEQIILETADLKLLRLLTQAIAQTTDYRQALEYFDRIKRIQIDTERIQARELDTVQLQLCKDWIREAIDEGQPVNGWLAFEDAKKVFPHEPELQLLGAELALSERDWSRAESLLKEGSYPQNLRNRAQNLEVLDHRGKKR